MSKSSKYNQSNFNAGLFALTLDPDKDSPLHVQLTDALRQMILDGPGLAGHRVPSSRALAGELSVSRMTVTTAYDQLLSEGYLFARQGGGTFIAEHIPHLAPPVRRRTRQPAPPNAWLPFQPGLPDPSLFPFRQWARCLERAWRSPAADLLAQPDSFGYFPLRTAISEHLAAWRGLQCDPNQIVITAGAWDAFDIICQSAFEPGQEMAVEDPGWAPLRQALLRSRINPVPVPIDGDGLRVSILPGTARGVVATPSRHYPTGISMPVARRLALLDWAKQRRAWIVEDDYDSEFRYQGQPLPSLAGLDGLRHTIYLGSFSKLLSPALRLGYVVLPETLIGVARARLSLTGSRASLVPQPALAEFMDSGDFATHLRRCRRLYARRQAVLVSRLQGISNLVDVQPDPSGMHLCCPLRPELAARATDRDIAALCAGQGLTVRALSTHSTRRTPQQGLLLGYAAFDEDVLSDAAGKLSDLLRQMTRTAG